MLTGNLNTEEFLFGGTGLDEFDAEACLRGTASDPVFGDLVFFGCDSIEPSADVCVDNFTGQLHQPRELECGINQQGIIFELDGPVTLCVNSFTGAIAAVPRESCTAG